MQAGRFTLIPADYLAIPSERFLSIIISSRLLRCQLTIREFCPHAPRHFVGERHGSLMGAAPYLHSKSPATHAVFVYNRRIRYLSIQVTMSPLCHRMFVRHLNVVAPGPGTVKRDA